ncbi:hypothetical protein [Spiroplasma endosymbiont of Nebria brevicollis]|uniref:hypothetical protein n=1 Tax=Spiroplasma endosymbiont of Nebria brevicollis TaxID=3066284 RepID=UPI00313AB551
MGSEATPKAVSVGAGDFLVNVFKLQVVAGTGADRTFTRSEAALIVMTVKTWSPTIAKKGTDDYAVNGGTVVVQFKKGTAQLGVDYTLDILAQPNLGIVADKATLAADDMIMPTNFVKATLYSDLTKVVILKETTDNSKTLISLKKLLKQGDLTATITGIKDKDTTDATYPLVERDKALVSIKIGTIEILRNIESIEVTA